MQPVFISFASKDAALAERALTWLERSGLRCWWSERDIEAAASYPTAITDAIKNSGALLLVLTDTANESPHVLREVELAFASRKPILPVRIGGARPSSDLQYFLSRSQWLDAGASLDDDELARIESRLREVLSGRPNVVDSLLDSAPAVRIAVVALVVVAGVVAFLVWNNDDAVDPPSTTVTDDRPGPQEEPTSAEPAATVKVNPRDGESYVRIPPGRFVMGCSAGDPACDTDEGPPHTVEIRRAFWLAQTEVTEPRFRAHAAGGTTAHTAAALPATRVSWAAAKAYCEAIAGRLPTEAEWEYAARAGSTSRYYDSLPAIAWFADNADGAPQPVGLKTPNAFGLQDMLGNVSEWVLDRYYNKYDDTSETSADVEQPLAGNASGVARGGSWLSDNDGVRVSRRLEMPPDAEEPHVGFRCAMDDI